MRKNGRKVPAAAVFAAVLIVAAVLCRVAGKLGCPIGYELSLVRSGIYLILLVAWGLSIWQRIIAPQVRFYILSICLLMIFWFSVRTVKYIFVSDNDVIRYLWYLYYVPFIFIPLLSLFVSLCHGKPEKHHLRRRTQLLLIPALLLLAAVLTNDLHQFVFAFPAGEPWTDTNRTHAFGYWLIFGWIVLCSVLSIVIMIRKCRAPINKKTIRLPFIPLIGAIVYAGLWMTGLPFLRFVAGDLTATLCVLYILIFESCIGCGLIRSNTHYRELFNASSIGAQITDESYRVILSSASSVKMPVDVLLQTAGASVMLDNGIRLSGAEIHAGHVIWQEDVSELLNVISELENTGEDLKGKNDILAREYKTDHMRRALAEKNRLYNMVQTQTEQQTLRLSELTVQLSCADDAEDIKRLISRIAILTAYIKRRNNLIFIAEANGTVPFGELEFCIRETLDNLALGGVACSLHMSCEGHLPFERVAYIYDKLENAIEIAADTLSAIYISVKNSGDEPCVHLVMQCNADMTAVKDENTSVIREGEDEWSLAFAAAKGGAEI